MPIIKDQKKLNDFCASLKGKEFITIDTEFLREKTYYPKLCLIQVSCPDGTAHAIDPIEGDMDLSPLFDLLLDKKILKVIHSGRQDMEIFFKLMGKVVEPIFDTQIAAMVCGYGDSIGYESLVRNLTGHQLDKSAQYTDWSRRPLSERQINYALGDVTYLIEVYQKLAAELEKRGRIHWVYEEEQILVDPKTYENDPFETWKRVKVKTPKPKTLAVLREIAAWRETRAQHKDIPKNWVMRDETLADMAAQMPKNAAQLKKIRNMSADMAEGKHGAQLLALIEKALASDPKTWPSVQKRKPLSPQASATVDILKMLLKIQSAEEGVAHKLIASSEDLEALAQNDQADIPALKGWRAEVFGTEALKLKHGDLAIGLKNGKITKFKVSGNTDTHD